MRYGLQKIKEINTVTLSRLGKFRDRSIIFIFIFIFYFLTFFFFFYNNNNQPAYIVTKSTRSKPNTLTKPSQSQ
jgi:hypothetical protein